MLNLIYTCFFLFFSFIWLVSATAQNIKITDQAFPNEPSIMMDPKNPGVIIAASNLNQYFISQDTGRTWSVHTLTSSHGVWGDPVISVDTNGHFYFFHLSNPSNGNWIDRIVCQKTTNQGETWSNGSYTGLNGAKAQDKQWCAIDRTDNTMYLTWTQFDDYGSTLPADSSTILFSKSTDAGETWSPALRINKIAGDCIDSDNTVEGAVPAVGPNGEVYVSWAGPEGIVFDRSLDKGTSWLENDIFVNPMPTGWDYTIPGILRANGLPITVCDLSHGPNHGTIYINWSDQRNGSNDTDIWLAKSNDGGNTWSDAIRVNDDGPGHHQFFTWMTIDQTNGYLYFIFYDRRNYQDNSTDVYMAVSTDGGNTFLNRRISETPFIPNSNIFFGDYTNLTVHDGIIRPIWTRLHEGELSIWTHLMNASDFTTAVAPPEDVTDYEFELYPNPSEEDLYISFKLHQRSVIQLNLIDLQGRIVRKLIKNEKRDYGKYVERVDGELSGIPAGVYILQLVVNKKVDTVRQVIVRE